MAYDTPMNNSDSTQLRYLSPQYLRKGKGIKIGEMKSEIEKWGRSETLVWPNVLLQEVQFFISYISSTLCYSIVPSPLSTMYVILQLIQDQSVHVLLS